MGRRRTLKSRRARDFKPPNIKAETEAKISRLKKRRTVELEGLQYPYSNRTHLYPD
jgi:hypothetical protein